MECVILCNILSIPKSNIGIGGVLMKSKIMDETGASSLSDSATEMDGKYLTFGQMNSFLVLQLQMYSKLLELKNYRRSGIS